MGGGRTRYDVRAGSLSGVSGVVVLHFYECRLEYLGVVYQTFASVNFKNWPDYTFLAAARIIWKQYCGVHARNKAHTFK